MGSEGKTKHKLGDIVARFGGELIGDPDTGVSRVASLESAAAGHICFFSSNKYRAQLLDTAASAVVLAPHDREATALPRIVSENPNAYFARVTALLNPATATRPGIHAAAEVDESACVSDSATIGAFSYVGKNVRVGARTVVAPGCHLGDNVTVGEDCLLHARAVVYHDCVVGNRVILHSGAVIGADGFGLAPENGRWLKVPQVGRVVIGDDVEIGANTTVDRGALDDTVLEEGVKLDNQIQVAHNVRIGAHTAMAGCVGIAGSARIGSHCNVGGAAMILGHLEITDRVTVSVGTLVTKSITKPGTYTSALPFAEHRTWLRNAAHLRHLDSLAERVRELEQRLNELERNKS